MKKIISIILATMLLASVAVFAAVPDVKAAWVKTLHVSEDAINAQNCNGNYSTYTAAAGTTEAAFWGWASSNTDFAGFSYSINGGEKVTAAAFKVPAEQLVKDTGEGAYDYRFDVKAAVTEGTQLVRVYADYVDGTSEAIWACEVTVGTASDYTDNEAAPETPSNPDTPSNPETPETPETPSNPETSDAMIVAIVAVATVALAGVAVSKKIRA